jgi:hypothetical protein
LPSLPNEAETLLLRAALLDGTGAITAFHEWRQRIDWNALNLGSQRILTQVYKNLVRSGSTTP